MAMKVTCQNQPHPHDLNEDERWCVNPVPVERWIDTAYALPPEGVVVQTVSPGGMESTLRRRGRLWFFPDGGMYVYYTPKWWREEVNV